MIVNLSEAKAKLSKLIDLVYHGDAVTKIDMVLTSPEERDQREVVRQARNEGVLL